MAILNSILFVLLFLHFLESFFLPLIITVIIVLISVNTCTLYLYIYISIYIYLFVFHTAMYNSSVFILITLKSAQVSGR